MSLGSQHLSETKKKLSGSQRQAAIKEKRWICKYKMKLSSLSQENNIHEQKGKAQDSRGGKNMVLNLLPLVIKNTVVFMFRYDANVTNYKQIKSD